MRSVIKQRRTFSLNFNGIYRTGVLDAWSFLSLTQVREERQRWLLEYNTARPHE